MFRNIILKKNIVYFLVILFLSCNKGIKTPDVAEVRKDEVKVIFFNNSSFKVDIYKNVNPSSSDKSTRPIATLRPGAVSKVKMPPSENHAIGDIFYIHYYVQLVDALSSGTGTAVYVKAERDIFNIPIILKRGKSYTQDIPQPEKDKLKFLNGYIRMQNTGKKSFQVKNANAYLNKLGTDEANLASGEFAFYEFPIFSKDQVSNISSLKVFVIAEGKYLTVPSFEMERGKMYNFKCDGIQIIGPSVNDISY